MATDTVALHHAEVGNGCCNKKGPGYATPLEAMSGPKETLIYVTCIYTGKLLPFSLIGLNLFCFLFYYTSSSFWVEGPVWTVCLMVS